MLLIILFIGKVQSLSFIVCVIRLVKKFPVQYQIRKTVWERERERGARTMDRPGKKGRKMESKGVTIEQRKRYKTMRKAQRKRWRARKKATREMGERTVLEEQGKLLVTLRRKVICEQSAMGMMEGRRTERKEEMEGEMDEDTQEKGEEMHHEFESRGKTQES